MTGDDWRALMAAVERARTAVESSSGEDRSPDSQLGPRLSYRRCMKELERAIDDATARGDVPAWVVRYANQVDR